MHLTNFYRLPVGSFGGILSKINARILGTYLLDAVLKQEKDLSLDYLLVGCTMQASLGPNLSSQIVSLSKRLDKIPSTTINSGANTALSMVDIAKGLIKNNKSIKNVGILCVECLSLVPHYVYIAPKDSNAKSISDLEMKNGVILDTTYVVDQQQFSGPIMEKFLEESKMTREHMDLYSKTSFEKTMRSNFSEEYKEHIIPVKLNMGENSIELQYDQEYRRKTLGKFGTFNGIFKKDGVITFANAAKFGDGAAFVTISSESSDSSRSLSPVYQEFTSSKTPLMAGIASAKKALKKEKVKSDLLDAAEINESFASCSLLYQQELKLEDEVLNPYGSNVGRANPTSVGGLISLGHSMMNFGRTLVSSHDIGGTGMSLITS